MLYCFFMDKYASVILGCMIVGIGIAFVSPDGEIREEPFFALFWASIIGAIAIIIYSSYSARKKQREANKQRKKFKK